MKVLVSVGTGSFNQLIEQVDKCLTGPEFEVRCQIGEGSFKPHHDHYSFSDDFNTDVEQADIVITHAGAATVFELLEKGKKTLVVPNQFRLDKHQKDLADYVEKRGFARACWQLADLKEYVLHVHEFDYLPYRKEHFFKAAELLDYFGLINER